MLDPQVTRSQKLEGIWWSDFDDRIYIVSSRETAAGAQHDGQVWVLDPAAQTIQLVAHIGGAKLPKLARSLGQAPREFKRGLHDRTGDSVAEDEPPAGTVAVRPPSERKYGSVHAEGEGVHRANRGDTAVCAIGTWTTVAVGRYPEVSVG